MPERTDPLEQVREAIETALHETVDARAYPDGPCMEAETRRDLRLALAALDEKVLVEDERLETVVQAAEGAFTFHGRRDGRLIGFQPTAEEIISYLKGADIHRE